MAEHAKLVSSGLKCDNPECDWKDESIPLDNNLHTYINMSCPKCGQNVLTLEDYENVQKVFAAAEFLNSLSPEEMERLSAMGNIEEAMKTDFLKNAKGLEHLRGKPDDLVSLSLNTHKKVSVTEIKKEN